MLGIRYPIIQGPLGGLSSQRLTAAVSNFRIHNRLMADLNREGTAILPYPLQRALLRNH